MLNLFVIEIYLNNQVTNRKLFFPIYESLCSSQDRMIRIVWHVVLKKSCTASQVLFKFQIVKICGNVEQGTMEFTTFILPGCTRYK